MSSSLRRAIGTVLCAAMLWLAGAFAALATPHDNPHGSGFAEHVEYLYIDAAEQNASGGHVALRLGDDVFHYQFEDGLLRIHQDRWRDFDLRYRGLQNRNIHVTRVWLSQEHLLRLRKAFRARFVSDSRQFALLDAARADAARASALADARPVQVPGLGFFPEDRSAAGADSSLAPLRQQVDRQLGPEFIAQRRAALLEEIRLLEPRGVEATAADFEPGNFPVPHYAFHERHADLLAGLRALDVLEGRATFDEARLRWLTGPLAALGDDELQKIERIRSEQREALMRLARGTRPDWGAAMLLGMARLEAMQRSLESGRWVLLDALALDAQHIEISPRQRGWVPELEAEARRDFELAREAFAKSDGWRERLYADLESSASRWVELRLALAGATALRVETGLLIPRAPGAVVSPPLPAALATAPERVAREFRLHAQRVATLAGASLGYDLIRRNCVSELFATLDAVVLQTTRETLGREDSAALRQTERAMFGGELPRGIGATVPFVSADSVRSHWRSAETRTLPSLRRARVTEMKSRQHALRVALRESNTFTARAYERGGRDSLFLFFTDDAGPARPLLGMGNLLFALAGSAVGIVGLPADRGDTLVRALSGALFSFPELVFQNVRKGTNEWLPSSEREWLGRSEGQQP